MNSYDKIYILILLLGMSYLSNSQSICDGRTFFTLPNGSNTALYQNTNDLFFEPVVPNLPTVNAIGFNPVDNNIYGFTYGAAQGGQLLQFSSDGQTANLLGPIQGVTPGGLWAGCFSPSGLYYLTGNAPQIYQIDVAGTMPMVVEEATLFYSNNSDTGSPAFGDIVVDPITGILYGYDYNLQKLASINPATGAIDAFGSFEENIPVVGGMVADAHGELYAFVLSEFYHVNKMSGEFTFLYDAPENNGGIDACNCSYYVDLIKSSSTSEACVGDTISYNFVITNTSQNALANLIFIDSLPDSFIITDVSDNLMGGTIEANSGIGFNHITINHMNLPEGISTFQLQVKLPTSLNEITTFFNQAKMTGFPSHLPSVLLSDDEETPVLDDATSIVVALNPDFNLEIEIPEINCVGDTIIINASSAEEGLFQWSKEDSLLSEEDFLILEDVTMEQTGNYDLRYTSTAGCVLDTIAAIAIFPNASVDLGEDTLVCLTEPYRLSAGVFSDYRWEDGSSEMFFLAGNYGPYSVSVTNEYGCEGKDTILLSSGCPAELYIPNAFSPNGDGVNDVFLTYGLEVTSFSLRIFSRWGEEVFYSNKITKGWDGFFLGESMGTGIYIYSLEASFLNGAVIRESGDISLLR